MKDPFKTKAGTKASVTYMHTFIYIYISLKNKLIIFKVIISLPATKNESFTIIIVRLIPHKKYPNTRNTYLKITYHLT